MTIIHKFTLNFVAILVYHTTILSWQQWNENLVQSYNVSVEHKIMIILDDIQGK